MSVKKGSIPVRTMRFAQNTPGSFTCTCYAGFQGDGETCTDVDECEEPLALEAVCTTPELPCEDVECVAAVSALDSFCTGLAWDAACVACASGRTRV